MTKTEYEAMRDKHRDTTWYENPGCICCEYTEVPACADGCQVYEYPCDTIKVLNELYEAEGRIERAAELLSLMLCYCQQHYKCMRCQVIAIFKGDPS